MRKATIYQFSTDHRTSQLAMKADRALAKQAADGDREAFRQIVEMNKQRMFSVAKNVLRDGTLAEDAVQEAFIKAYRALPNFKGESRLSTWLYRITYMAAIDVRRQHLRHLRLATDSFEPEQMGDKDLMGTGESAAEADCIRQQIDQALSQLSEFEQIVFSLRHKQQLKLREIAVVVDRSEGTIKNVLFRAIRKLRDALAQDQALLQETKKC